MSAGSDPREKDLTIPEQHRAAVFAKHGEPIKLDHVPTPRKLQTTEALVHVLYTGVCHTDLHTYLNDWPMTSTTHCGGHEGAGIVVALGDGADRYLKVGDRVGIKWIASSCLQCEYCRKGYEQNCPRAKLSGFTIPGTFQEFAISDAACLTRIPEDLSLEIAAPLLCASLTVYHACRSADITPGDIVAVSGAGGGLGHLAIQFVTLFGGRVLAIDTGDEKERLVKSLAPDAIWIDYQKTQDIVKTVKEATPDGHGPSSAIVAASAQGAFETAFEYLRPRGSLILVGLPPHGEVKLPIFNAVFSCKRVIGSYVGNRQDAVEVLNLAAQHKVQVSYQKRGLSQLQQTFDEMKACKLAGRVVLDTSQ